MRNEMETFKLNNIIVSGGNDNKVLFLGEGNFSFSSSLVKTLAMDLSETSCDLSNIWTSCYESDLSKRDINERDEVAAEVKRSNVSYLRSRGCHVLEGVDDSDKDKVRYDTITYFGVLCRTYCKQTG